MNVKRARAPPNHSQVRGDSCIYRCKCKLAADIRNPVVFRSLSGVWELPLNAHYVESYEGGHCPYLDQCVLHNHDPEEVFEWLQEDFNRYYEQNRAPYMMPFHTNWFQIKELERGLSKFLDWAVTL